jgi:hypothetical protein
VSGGGFFLCAGGHKSRWRDAGATKRRSDKPIFNHADNEGF